MPWADEESTRRVVPTPAAPRRAAQGRDRRRVAVRPVPADESSLVGSFGLMARKWPATIEIGYWVHVDDDRPRSRDPREPRAHRTPRSRSTASPPSASAATKPTCAAPRCPARLGFTLVAHRDAHTRGAGRDRVALMIWERTEPMLTPRLTPVTAQRFFDALHHVGASSRSITSSATRFSRTCVDPARAGDHGRHVRVLRAPRERQLRERATEIVGDRLQPAHAVLGLLVVHRCAAATRSRAARRGCRRGCRRGTCR